MFGLGESEDPRVAPKRSRHVDAKRETKVRVIAEGGEGRSGSGKSNHRVPHFFFFRGPTSAVGDASAKAKRPSPREEERTNDDRKRPSELAAAPD